MTKRTVGLVSLTSHEAVVGIAIGACAAGDPWSQPGVAANRVVAHAHYTGKRKGWICIRRLRGYNATTIRHELAHLIRENARHDDAWRREVRGLGGQVEPSYRKRTH